MTYFQQGILTSIPAHAEYLYFQLTSAASKHGIQNCLSDLASLADGENIVLGLGQNLCQKLGLHIAPLRGFTIEAPPGNPTVISTKNTNADLWCWLRSDERGNLVELQNKVQNVLTPHFELTNQVPAFRYKEGRDLTGYEDGTENPIDGDAIATAFLNDPQSPLHGSSFVAVQQWQHQMHRFHALSGNQQDHTIGRRLSDNEELEDAPPSAHVKRTAQENFEPEAFVLRRSMPWSRDSQAGLLFTAFATSFDAFEAQFSRMLGLDDGVSDALFNISQPINTHYFWCPPVSAGRLNLNLSES